MALIDVRLVSGSDVADMTISAADITDGTVTGAKLTTTARTKLFSYQIEDLAAGVDIAGREIWQLPQGGVTTINRVEIHFEEATVGVDGANTLTIAITGPGGAIATTGALTANQTAGTTNVPSLTNNTGLAVAGNITLDVTQGATADAGLVSVFVYYEQAA